MAEAHFLSSVRFISTAIQVTCLICTPSASVTMLLYCSTQVRDRLQLKLLRRVGQHLASKCSSCARQILGLFLQNFLQYPFFSKQKSRTKSSLCNEAQVCTLCKCVPLKAQAERMHCTDK